MTMPDRVTTEAEDTKVGRLYACCECGSLKSTNARIKVLEWNPAEHADVVLSVNCHCGHTQFNIVNNVIHETPGFETV